MAEEQQKLLSFEAVEAFRKTAIKRFFIPFVLIGLGALVITLSVISENNVISSSSSGSSGNNFAEDFNILKWMTVIQGIFYVLTGLCLERMFYFSSISDRASSFFGTLSSGFLMFVVFFLLVSWIVILVHKYFYFSIFFISYNLFLGSFIFGTVGIVIVNLLFYGIFRCYCPLSSDGSQA